jgi:ubiquinone/menaquinone biosynthesis C-methylase UbiE
MEQISAYSEKFNAELSRFENVESVHALPDIFHYWSGKYLLPKLQALGFDSLVGFFFHYISDSCNRRKGDITKIVSLGAGNSDFEVDLAGRLRELGTNNFHFLCLEMNVSMLERGKVLAANSGLSNHFSFMECDLNNWTTQQQFDSILAIHSLHHVMALEKLFDEVHRSLSDDGAFLINDMIGRNGHLRWPEALEVVQAFWKELPHSKKYNHQLKRFEDEFVNWDCSTEGFEGIRAQDILPELTRRFEFDCFLGFSNVIDIFVDRSFGHNFDPKNESDLAFIDRVATTDDALLESGKIKPTHMIAALKKQGAALKTYKHLTPEFCVRRP